MIDLKKTSYWLKNWGFCHLHCFVSISLSPHSSCFDFLVSFSSFLRFILSKSWPCYEQPKWLHWQLQCCFCLETMLMLSAGPSEDGGVIQPKTPRAQCASAAHIPIHSQQCGFKGGKLYCAHKLFFWSPAQFSPACFYLFREDPFRTGNQRDA